MKKLIVALIVLTPFIAVSQVSNDSLWKSLRHSSGSSDITYNSGGSLSQNVSVMGEWTIIDNKPDTLSAYLLITTRHMGIAYQRRGFIVRQYGKEDVYLDCEKRIIKAPFTIWHAKLINQPK